MSFAVPSRRGFLCGATALAALATLPSRMALAARTAEDERLNAFFEDCFQTLVARNPEAMTYLGVPGEANGRWTDLSEAWAAGTAALERDFVDRAGREFDPSKLSDQGRLNLRLFRYVMGQSADEYRWRLHSYSIEHFNGRHLGIPSLLNTVQQVTSEETFGHWLSRVRAVPAAVDQMIEATEMRANKGVLPPRFSLEKCLHATRGVLVGAPFEPGGAESAMLASIRATIDALAIPAERRQSMVEEARAALESSFAPAYRRLISTIEALIVRSDDRDGVWKLPDGDAFYRSCLRRHTTVDMSADEIHALGLAQVDRIHTDMKAIMDQVGFTGDLKAFFAFLRDDDRFYYPDTPEGHAAYLAEARRVVSEVEKALEGQFGVRPKQRVEVRRFDPFREGSEAIARYYPATPDGSRPGTYFVNFSNMREMPKYQLEVLAFHEAIPGHHMQIAIAQQLEDLPKFRRYADFTAFIEGWGLYSERLPKELGFYKDPYSDFGRLSFQLWRAIRLVVDTGIHAKRWSREQAIEYFTANSSFVRESAAREIDRYIVFPGQACAYLIGMLRILELRDKARTALGPRFDIRGFHDTLLENGAVPLEILGEIVDGWVQSRKA